MPLNALQKTVSLIILSLASVGIGPLGSLVFAQPIITLGNSNPAAAQLNCASIMVQCDPNPPASSGSIGALTPSPSLGRLNFDYPLEGVEISPSELPVFPPYRPRGVPPRTEVFALWFGSAKNEEQAELIWQTILPTLSEILDNPQPQYLVTLIPAEYAETQETTLVTRIYLGPIPDEAIGWQVCNVLKLEVPQSFCKPWNVNDI